MPRRKPLPIDHEVKAAIDQLKPEELQRLRKFAHSSAELLARAGEPIAPDEHEQLLRDATNDTMCLVVTWNRRTPMAVHLRNVIKRRISNSLRRVKKRSNVSLEVLDADEVLSGRGRGGLEAQLARAQVTERLYQVARERATGDQPVLWLLDAYQAEVFDRADVVAWTGLTVSEFVNARRRLDRLLAALPAELRLAALAAMREMDIAQMSETTSETIDRE